MNSWVLRRKFECHSIDIGITDLHFGLLEKGDYIFWKYTIVQDSFLLPCENDFRTKKQKREEFGPFLWDHVKKQFVDRKKSRLYFEDYSKKSQVKFSYDVIITLEDLAHDLNVVEKEQCNKQQLVEELLELSDQNVFEEFVIFNAKKQLFQQVYGIPMEKFRQALMKRKEESLNGLFNKESLVKNSILQQRLDLLSIVLYYILVRYSVKHSPKVSYVELSMDVDWLTLPWVYDVLKIFLKGENNSFGKVINKKSLQMNFTESINYRFLASFNRELTELPEEYKGNERDLLMDVKRAVDLITYECNTKTTRMFKVFEDQLKNFTNIDFHKLIVGFDLKGEPWNYPYCPFITQQFIDFVQDARKINQKFGIRFPVTKKLLTHENAYPEVVDICLKCLQRYENTFNKIRVVNGKSLLEKINLEKVALEINSYDGKLLLRNPHLNFVLVSNDDCLWNVHMDKDYWYLLKNKYITEKKTLLKILENGFIFAFS